MKNKLITLVLLSFAFFIFTTGCNQTEKPSEKHPVTLTMWHNYGGDMQKTMNSLIDEFNSTVGKDQGIIIDVKEISSSAELNMKVFP